MDKTDNQEKTAKSRINPVKLKLVLKYALYAVLALIFLALLVNAMLAAFSKKYVPSFFGFKTLSIVSDSMENKIMTGDLIFVKQLNGDTELKKDDIISYYINVGGSSGTVIITHRIIEIKTIDGQTAYSTKGDNALSKDNYYVAREDIVGVYEGGRIPLVGYFFGFLGSAQGIIALILLFLLVFSTMYINGSLDKRDKVDTAKQQALKKSLLFVDNIGKNFGYSQEMLELTEIINIVSDNSKKKKEPKNKEIDEKKLESFNKVEYKVLADETMNILASPQALQLPSPIADKRTKGSKSKKLKALAQADSTQPIPLPSPKQRAKEKNRAMAELKRLRELNELLRKGLVPLTQEQQKQLRKMQRQQAQKAKEDAAREQASMRENSETNASILSADSSDIEAAATISPQTPRRAPIDPETARLRKEQAAERKAKKEQAERDYLDSLSETDRALYILANERREEELRAISQLKKIEKQRSTYEKVLAKQTNMTD